MRQELAALVVHDLKNAVGVLEAQLCALQAAPDQALAALAHRQCMDMRRRFMAFLLLYGAQGELRASPTDESPQAFLGGLSTLIAGPESAAVVRLGDCRGAPACWMFDVRLVRMALESALHNAWRFARHEIVLDAHEDAGCLLFTVEDDGPGPGHPDDCAASTGLGIELCRAVARAHGTPAGREPVRLVQRAGGGARFELRLP